MKCLLDKMDFDDIKISYIGEEEATDDVDLNEEYEPKNINVVWNKFECKNISSIVRKLIWI